MGVLDPNPLCAPDEHGWQSDEYSTGRRLGWEYAHLLRWVQDWNCWMVSKNGVWHREYMEESTAAAAHVCTAQIVDNREGSRTSTHIKNVLSQAKKWLVMSPESFDNDPWIINTPAGHIDLQIDSARVDGEDDLFRYQTAVSPRAMPTPLWDKHLEMMCHGDKEQIGLLQQLAGMSLVGDQRVKDQVNPILNGLGRNGKGAFLGVLLYVLGDYAIEAPTRLLTAKDGAHPAEQVLLEGKRFVVLEELKDMNPELFKLLSGGGIHTARDIREKNKSFVRGWTFWFNNNGALKWRDPTDGLWERVEIFDFGKGIDVDARVRDWGNQLQQEGPGILQWAVDGCEWWQRKGLWIPDSVKNVVATRRCDADPLSTFIDERYARDEDGRVPASSFMNEYVRWCKDSGEPETGGRNSVYNDIRGRLKFRVEEYGKNKKLHIFGLRSRPITFEDTLAFVPSENTDN